MELENIECRFCEDTGFIERVNAPDDIELVKCPHCQSEDEENLENNID